jgi:hypothetical protein
MAKLAVSDDSTMELASCFLIGEMHVTAFLLHTTSLT